MTNNTIYIQHTLSQTIHYTFNTVYGKKYTMYWTHCIINNKLCIVHSPHTITKNTLYVTTQYNTKRTIYSTQFITKNAIYI
jgi:hypothetical protein